MDRFESAGSCGSWPCVLECLKLLAVMQRTECKDYMSLIACKKWTPVAHVQLATQDAQDLSFSPNGSCLCIWDSLDYHVFIHGMDGSCLASYRAYSEPALGIRAACWGPSGQLLALGGFDNVRMSPEPRQMPVAMLDRCSSKSEGQSQQGGTLRASYDRVPCA